MSGSVPAVSNLMWFPSRKIVRRSGLFWSCRASGFWGGLKSWGAAGFGDCNASGFAGRPKPYEIAASGITLTMLNCLILLDPPAAVRMAVGG